MKRAIVVVASTLILTAGQAMAERVTPPRHVNGSSAGLHPCYCTCLDNSEGDCCPHCSDEPINDYRLGGADHGDNLFAAALRRHVVQRAQSSMPNSARPKQFERTTNRCSTPIRGATPHQACSN